jgi:ferredoxin
MSIKKIFIPLFLVLAAIIGSVTFLFKKSNQAPSNNNLSDQQNFDQIDTNHNQLQKLSLLSTRCIGCGKCARFDSSHFQMDPSTSKAIIISSTNLDSKNLVMAINNCPTQAIVLE